VERPLALKDGFLMSFLCFVVVRLNFLDELVRFLFMSSEVSF